MENGCHTGDTRSRGLRRGLSWPRTSRGDGRSRGPRPLGGAPPSRRLCPHNGITGPHGPQGDTLQAEATAPMSSHARTALKWKSPEGPPPDRFPVPQSQFVETMSWRRAQSRGCREQSCGHVHSRGAGVAHVGKNGVPLEESAGSGGTGQAGHRSEVRGPAVQVATGLSPNNQNQWQAPRSWHRGSSHTRASGWDSSECAQRGRLDAPQTAQPTLCVHCPTPASPSTSTSRATGQQRASRE